MDTRYTPVLNPICEYKTMKIQRLLVITALIGSATLAFANPKFSEKTANYYKGAYEDFEGKEITLKVSYITPSDRKSNIPGVQFFLAHTRDSQKKVRNGGEILIGVLSAKADSLMRKYGVDKERQEGREVELKGTLRADGSGRWFVDVEGDLTDNLNARDQRLIK